MKLAEWSPEGDRLAVVNARDNRVEVIDRHFFGDSDLNGIDTCGIDREDFGCCQRSREHRGMGHLAVQHLPAVTPEPQS